MSNLQANSRVTIPGFWKRLVLAARAMGESYEEQLEKRVRSLETTVARLAESQQQRKTD